MQAFVFSFLAAGCAAMSNLFFRKSSAQVAADFNPNGYLLVFYFFSFLSSILFNAVWNVPISLPILIISGCVGALNVLLMSFTAKALSSGPSGLTFAFQNAAAVFPGILLFLFFGSQLGYSCSLFQVLGVTLVLLGLFVGAKQKSDNKTKAQGGWIWYALACFLVQILALTCIQGRCILFDTGNFLSYLGVTKTEDAWFMPGQFGTALCLQAFLFFRDKKKLESKETFCGFFGGIANFACTCLLLLATKTALPFQQSILFPIFAVATIVLCNVWSNRLYGEKFNLLSNSICACGIFLGVLT